MTFLAKSRAVLDYPLKKQKGPTTRIIDAMTTGTKVITTTKNIQGYPFYNDNILVVSKLIPHISEMFIDSEYHDCGERSLNIKMWLDRVIGEG